MTPRRDIHLIIDGRSDPAANMAVDDALLGAHNLGELDGTWMRLYGWRPAAVSLGRLQALERALDLERLTAAGVAVVRRATGGQAVYHDGELTYSIVGALDDPTWGDQLHATYHAATSLISAGLDDLGIDTQLAGGRPPRTIAAGEDLRAACFAVAYGHELVHGGKKICGSAQRRLVRSFLQHGSLLIDDSHCALADFLRVGADRRALRHKLAAESTDVCAALGHVVDFEPVLEAVRRAVHARFGARVVEGSLPPAVARAADSAREAVELLRGVVPEPDQELIQSRPRAGTACAGVTPHETRDAGQI